jgi:hypothetical protein
MSHSSLESFLVTRGPRFDLDCMQALERSTPHRTTAEEGWRNVGVGGVREMGDFMVKDWMEPPRFTTIPRPEELVNQAQNVDCINRDISSDTMSV